MDRNVVTRFAPSPTGFMHIGSVRTALFAYLFARQHAGAFILRIEDTDKEREVSGSTTHIQESLSWLGLTYDHGPDAPGPFGSCIQSERLDSYHAYAQRLIECGHAYADPRTSEEIAALKAAATSAEQPFFFRDHRPSDPPTWDGSQPLRFKLPAVKRYTWHDAVRGELTAGEETLDDLILIKSDGYPTYNFAHIVDDHEMGVTHVMRGDEFISSMPKFLSLYEALELPLPVFATLPPILRPDRSKKLGKRDGAKDILEYRTDGYLPEALVNFLALTGWNPGTDEEIFTQTELIERFSLSQIQRAGAVFNEEKLRWMNGEHLKRRSTAEQVAYVRNALTECCGDLPQFSPEQAERLTPTVLERSRTTAEIREAAAAGEYDFAFQTPEYERELLRFKQDADVTAAGPRLSHVIHLLEDTDFSTPEAIKAALWPYAEEEGRGAVLWPTRVALTGRERSPDPFTVAYVIGQTEALRRLKTACAKIGG